MEIQYLGKNRELFDSVQFYNRTWRKYFSNNAQLFKKKPLFSLNIVYAALRSVILYSERIEFTEANDYRNLVLVINSEIHMLNNLRSYYKLFEIEEIKPVPIRLAEIPRREGERILRPRPTPPSIPGWKTVGLWGTGGALLAAGAYMTVSGVTSIASGVNGVMMATNALGQVSKEGVKQAAKEIGKGSAKVIAGASFSYGGSKILPLSKETDEEQRVPDAPRPGN